MAVVPPVAIPRQDRHERVSRARAGWL